MAELENDRFEQLLKMQREGEEDRKKSEMERREQQRNEEYRKQKSLRDDEEILQVRNAVVGTPLLSITRD